LGRDHSQNLAIKEDPNKGIYVKDLTTVIVKTVHDTEKTLFAGLRQRKTGETAMNKDSSRSHSIFTIYIETAEDTNVFKIMKFIIIGWYWQIKNQGWKIKPS
jgi:hypothetical protein